MEAKKAICNLNSDEYNVRKNIYVNMQSRVRYESNNIWYANVSANNNYSQK